MMSADTKTKTTALFIALVCPSALIVESTNILNELVWYNCSTKFLGHLLLLAWVQYYVWCACGAIVECDVCGVDGLFYTLWEGLDSAHQSQSRWGRQWLIRRGEIRCARLSAGDNCSDLTKGDHPLPPCVRSARPTTPITCISRRAALRVPASNTGFTSWKRARLLFSFCQWNFVYLVWCERAARLGEIKISQQTSLPRGYFFS